MFKRPRIALPIALLALVAAMAIMVLQSDEGTPRTRLGLMTSLPIYWESNADIASLAAGHGETPWPRTALEERYILQPVDSLAASAGTGQPQFERLMIAQPRALSPQDNVVLDDWVNRGGRVLLMLDPLLTGSYSVPLGDPSHPSAVALVPPVLARWGLGLRFDENQPLAVQWIDAGGIELPVAMAGEVHLLEGEPARCTVSETGILAQCEIGRGRVTLVADAALFEFAEGSDEVRKSLSMLAEFAFE